MIPILSLVQLWTLAAAQAPPPAPAGGEEIVVEMASVSVFDIERSADFIRGSYSECSTEPSEEVARYPELASTVPLHGFVQFPGAPAADGGEARFFWVLDESQGTGRGYDRLYLDRDRDLDLSDETPLERLEDPPPRAVESWDSIVQQACFERFEVACDFGDAGTRPVEVMARLMIRQYEDVRYSELTFMDTRCRRGRFEIGGTRYFAHLGHDRTAVGRYDGPGTALFLSRGARQSRIYWWGGDRLSALHELDGTHYEFAATPTGDELTVRPWGGAFGELVIGAGGRDLTTMNAEGSLRGEEHSVAVGEGASSGRSEPVERCRLPVGNYHPYYLTIRYDDLSIDLSNNYHSDGRPRESNEEPVFGIEIREDRPFALDFSNEPEVLFASPGRDLRLKPGEQLYVAAVLIDPVLDVMIRGLDEHSGRPGDSDDPVEAFRFSRGVSLDPQVIITRKNGERIARGTMPFG